MKADYLNFRSSASSRSGMKKRERERERRGGGERKETEGAVLEECST